jgi:hypothetical protein
VQSGATFAAPAGATGAAAGAASGAGAGAGVDEAGLYKSNPADP